MGIRYSERQYKNLKAGIVEEKHIQIQFVDWFKANYPQEIIYSNANEATYNRADLRRMGVLPGVPDITIAIPSGRFHGLYIEFKRPGKKASKNQIEVMEKLERKGYKCHVCHSFDCVVISLKAYLSA